MRFIDAHHHLWNLDHCSYPWLMARGVRRFFGDPLPIQKNYLVADLLSESPGWRPAKSVHIQVGAEVSDSLKESRWLQQVSTLEASGGLPNAIVAFVDLAAPDCAEQIGRQVNIPNVRGIRQIIGRHPDEDHQTGSNELIGNPAWKQGLALLAPTDMSFDLQLIPPQYADVCALLAALPELKVAICHCGSPWDQSTDGLEHWRAGMQRFAELPNVHCKVSGLGMFKHDWEIKDIRPLILDVIEIFGAERVMFGSNFPVDKLYGGYHRIWHAYDEITLELTDEERGKLFFGNAEKFYRI